MPSAPAPGSLVQAPTDHHEREVHAKADQGRAPHRWWVGLALVAVLTAPLLVALGALRRPQWYPILDLAMTELRVRDVGTADTPLIGLPGRIGRFGPEQGSHPGPLSFWALAPTYRLLGSTAWALSVGTVVVHVAAMGTALWIARRRGGALLVLGVAATLALLAQFYGASVLTQPWNPYLPLLWSLVALLGAWSVVDGDLPVLPVTAFAVTFAAQTHAPYLGLTGGIAAVALVGALVHVWAVRDRPDDLRRALRWIAAAGALTAVLWAAPVAEQLGNGEQGNIARLVDHFGSPPEEAVGSSTGVDMVLLHLDPWRLVTGEGEATQSLVDASQRPTGSRVPGTLLLVAALASAAVAVRLRHRALVALHLVLGAALVLGAVAISRIFGQLWYYLMIWMWGVTALLLLAVTWTVAAAVARRDAEPARAGGRRVGAAVLATVTVASTVAFALESTDTEPPALPLVRVMAGLVPPTVDALASGDVVGGGRDGRYLVTWSDVLHIGAQGIALVNELEREGFDAGGVEAWGVSIGTNRVWEPSEATAVVHLANGFHVDRWRAKPGVEEVASIDTRTDEQRAAFDSARSQVITELRAAGLEDLVDDVDANLFAAAIDQRVPQAAEDGMTLMLDLGLPTSIFVGPVSAVD